MQFFFRICPLGGFFSSLLCAALWLLYFSIVTSGEGTAWYAYGWESQLLGKEDTSGGVLMDQGGGHTAGPKWRNQWKIPAFKVFQEDIDILYKRYKRYFHCHTRRMRGTSLFHQVSSSLLKNHPEKFSWPELMRTPISR